MTRERIHQLVDLVLDTEHWGKSNRACIMVDGDTDNWVTIHLNVGSDSTSTTYFSDTERADTYPDGYILDPNFDAAEARLKQLLMEVKGEDDA